MIKLPPGLSALSPYNQFILWKEVPEGEKIIKYPINPHNMRVADAHDPAIWMPIDTALAAVAGLGKPYGLGFSFTVNDPFFFIDIDNCLDGDKWSPIANELMAALTGAAVEVSVSGRGLHIIGQGTVTSNRRIKCGKLFDLYTEKRFVALTGDRVVGTATTDCTAALAAIVEKYLKPMVHSSSGVDGWTTEPQAGWVGPDDDAELLATALLSGGMSEMCDSAATFKHLWESDDVALTRHFPSDQGEGWDASRVDLALAQRLAFWTGNNCERIDRMMRMSVHMRDKYDRNDGYLETTILKAVSMQTKLYVKPTKKKKNDPGPTAVKAVDDERVRAVLKERFGFQMLIPELQKAHFKGCVYIADQDRILTPNGALLKSNQFKVLYGGYTFGMDSANRRTCRNAWEAFTESQALDHPTVDTAAFKPALEPGEIVGDEHGRLTVNTYVPAMGKRVVGDPSVFLTHVAKLLPNQADREILLSYMAACVQRPGVKFQWCPLIQGVQGNGKTVMYSVLSYAVGKRYSHQLDPKDMETSVFNAWIENRLLVGVEEIRMRGKHELAERLKPLITNEDVPVQGKGADQRTGENCANFIMCSNHKDAVLKTEDDRRYCVFYTAQQAKSDLLRDGMAGPYFPELWKWLRGDGYAVVADYLHTRAISCDLGGHAPDTSSTFEAKAESLGTCEQIVKEAVDSDEIGFQGGLVCVRYASELLQRNRKNLSPKAVIGVLEALGYSSHPALADCGGRLRIAGVKQRIFVASNAASLWLLRSAEELRTAYEELNGPQMRSPTHLSAAK